MTETKPPSTGERILAAVMRLNGAAGRNCDSFSFAIHIDVRPFWENRHFEFVCKKYAGGHEIISRGGETLEEIADQLEDTEEIDSELKAFGFTLP
jgi:hypothetical protein